MKIAVDLHIHTALSPCGDNDMTPNNIVNMALLKNLDAIAITDHNSGLNVNAVLKCAKDKDLLIIPGMEVETAEEVHIICLFHNIDDLNSVQDIIKSRMPSVEINEQIFGKQLVIDERDRILDKKNRLLSVATNIDIEELFKLVRENNGICIPAHIDRTSYSIISNLGYIPDNLNIHSVELSYQCDKHKFLKNNPDCKGLVTYKSSDAHYLKDILERECFFDVKQLTINGILRTLSKGKT